MSPPPSPPIRIVGARQNNLRGFDVYIRPGALTVVTGVSGSGKSSLAFDTLFREGQRRYLASLSSFARSWLGKLERPAVERIDRVPPALALDQRAVVRSPRSTVGTLTGLYDHLRLLFARVGEGVDTGTARPTASLFSFNTPLGACPGCKGLGVEDRVDPELLVADPCCTLREGALVPTTPTGYIVYSQVTVDVLDTVCGAHGFSVDVPWRELTDEQRRVVLYGSDRITVPFGKHPLESRMRWKGITARPRKEGLYRGIVPVIEEILARSRNRNALRFVRTEACRACGGARLRPEALVPGVDGRSIAGWARRTVADAAHGFGLVDWTPEAAPIARPIVEAFVSRASCVTDLGLDHLPLDRPSTTLSAGEIQRLRLATQVGSGLRGLLYVLDEPSVGLHPRDTGRLLALLRRLRDAGNTVVVVEHDPATIRAADELIDIGPGAGAGGGELLYAGPPAGLLEAPAVEGPAAASPTRAFLLGEGTPGDARVPRGGSGELWIRGAREHNLQGIDVPFLLGALNVVTGVSGAGKTTLVDRTLGRALRRDLHGATPRPGEHDAIEGAETLDKLIAVDQAPIGRSPRSNAATYTKVFDPIRTLFAETAAARERGWGKGHFSLNVAGGRCERCHGAGVETVGMHFLGDVDVTCGECHGRRFGEETLEVRYRGRSVLDVLEMSVDRAAELFADRPKIHRVLDALRQVGLGYLALGQPATTLSGGEAQRVKLAAELGRPSTGRTLLLLDEPTRGLHLADVDRLLSALDRLVERGNTVIVVEHDPAVISVADRVVDLGPESGSEGGELVAVGSPAAIAAEQRSFTGAALRGEFQVPSDPGAEGRPGDAAEPIRLVGVATHNLRELDLELPANRLVAITGVSGSGKSSLAFDTLYEESRARFAENLPTAVRRRAGAASAARLAAAHGLSPAIGFGQRRAAGNPRSTVATMIEAHDALRLLFSRIGLPHCPACDTPLEQGHCPECGFSGTWPLRAAHFSFNDHRGACPDCRGLGAVTTCDPERLINRPDRPLAEGAMDGHRSGRYLGESDGRHMALLRAVGEVHGVDYSLPWERLDEPARRLALCGTGGREYDASWRYKRGRRVGTHEFRGTWDGLIAYVDEEYARKHADRRGAAMRALMLDHRCPTCAGHRLAAEYRAVRVAGESLGELGQRSVDEIHARIDELLAGDGDAALEGRAAEVARGPLEDVLQRLGPLKDLGLGYLSLDRAAPSLSAGEFQRVRLAAQLGSRLRGVTYVLDEPTSGLHARDTDRLLQVLRRLRDGGNTVVVVEHDPAVIRAADHVVELGPGAGDSGGEIVAQGPPEAIARQEGSRIARHLSGWREQRTLPTSRHASSLVIRGAKARNLRGIDVEIPAGTLVAVTGVSGSGKSSLVLEVLGPSLERGRPVACSAVEGGDQVSEVITLDGSSLPRSALTNPASHCGAMDVIRGIFARSDRARDRGWTRRWFALTGKGGRCDVCGGTGRRTVELGFLPEIHLPCDACQGARYSAEALEVRVGGSSIAQVLDWTVDGAVERWGGRSGLGALLAPLQQVGLGYLRLGQPTDTLSAGEAQRLRLSGALAGSSGGRNGLYLLDEPTRGLHPDDVEVLLGALHRLVEAGHTVVAIEHDLPLIRAAGWVVDLGPEGGAGGGALVATGTPAQVAEHPTSFTGAALRHLYGEVC